MLKLMWVEEKPMWIPVTEQEDAERVAMIEAVRNIPEIMPEQIADNAGYIGKHAENVSVYDAMLAEIYAEHDGEKARVRNRRHADRKHPENKMERKKEKQNRMHRLYGLAYEDTKYGKTVFFWDKKEGQKKFPEYEAEIFKNLKERSAESVARADWELEQRDIEIARLDAEIMAEYAEWEARREWEDMCRKLNDWLKYA